MQFVFLIALNFVKRWFWQKLWTKHQRERSWFFTLLFFYKCRKVDSSLQEPNQNSISLSVFFLLWLKPSTLITKRGDISAIISLNQKVNKHRQHNNSQINRKSITRQKYSRLTNKFEFLRLNIEKFSLHFSSKNRKTQHQNH